MEFCSNKFCFMVRCSLGVRAALAHLSFKGTSPLRTNFVQQVEELERTTLTQGLKKIDPLDFIYAF